MSLVRFPDALIELDGSEPRRIGIDRETAEKIERERVARVSSCRFSNKLQLVRAFSLEFPKINK